MNTNWYIKLYKYYIEVSSNEGTSKSSILIGFSILNHPLGGAPIYSYIHMIYYIDIDIDVYIYIISIRICVYNYTNTIRSS